MTNAERLMTKELPNDESSEASEVAFWGAELSIVREGPEDGASKYDLEERTACFGEAVIDFAKTMPQGPVTNRLIDQLVGAGTAIGANYCEADDAVSRKEFFCPNLYLPKRSKGDEALSPDDRTSSAGPETFRARLVAGSTRIASDFLTRSFEASDDIELRHSFVISHSVIRHSRSVHR